MPERRFGGSLTLGRATDRFDRRFAGCLADAGVDMYTILTDARQREGHGATRVFDERALGRPAAGYAVVPDSARHGRGAAPRCRPGGVRARILAIPVPPAPGGGRDAAAHPTLADRPARPPVSRNTAGRAPVALLGAIDISEARPESMVRTAPCL
ncbi:MAG TPA: hypothetical protein VFT84_12245, partial [Gemmatimonadales bacterium]|nr:hypothetical protein [Gemmatimonadales bacterium]